MVEEVKVTRNYQVTIPASARTKLGVKVGDVLVAELRDSAIVLEKKSSDIAQLRLRLDRKEKIDWRDVESGVREAGAKFGNSRRR
jgi:antitoxin PrlF